MYQDVQASFTKDHTDAGDNDAQTVVGTAGVAIVSKNIIDMGEVAGVPRMALKQPTYKNNYDAACVPLHIQIVEDLAGATGGLKIDVVNADNQALSTNPVVLYTTTIALADAKAGKVVLIKELPMGITKRYLGLKFTPLTADSTKGAVSAFVTTAKDLPSSL